MRQRPTEVWKAIVKYIGPPIDSRAYRITDWLRGDRFDTQGETGALPLIPQETIGDWVDENVEKRAWYVASFVPKQLFRNKDIPCLAREVLVRYGNREKVRTRLMANFSSEGWSGPQSEHLERKKHNLLEFKQGETDGHVKRWIDEYVENIDRQIERARINEEREF